MIFEFNYENVAPETLKEWEREYRNKCRREMTQYLKDFPDATPEERRALSSWVRSGHSPYENGDFIATESGDPMDFINARRFLEAEYQEYLIDPIEYRNFYSEPVKPSGGEGCTKVPDDELPF